MLAENSIYNGDCVELIRQIGDGTVDCVLTDPPYLYLNNGDSKWDKPFDEDTLFAEWKRVLKPKGFIVLFGRGESFYRWNVKLNELGFPFKEEVIWHKHRVTSPTTPISRVHETVSILGCGSIFTSYIKPVEKYEADWSNLERTVKDIANAIQDPDKLQEIITFLQTKQGKYTDKSHKTRYSITIRGNIKEIKRHISYIQTFVEGPKEQSVITVNESLYGREHPTQKPVRLIERLLALTTQPGDLVLDCFSGSGSTAIACQNTQRRFLGFEKDPTFYKSSLKRIRNNATLF